MKIFNYSAILSNKKLYFISFSRSIFKDINKITKKDILVRKELKEIFKTTIYLKTEEKYSHINAYKYKFNHEEAIKDFYSLFHLKEIFNKAANKDMKTLNRIYYLVYFIKLKEKSEDSMIIQKDHKNIKVRFSNTKHFNHILFKNSELEPLEYLYLPKIVRRHVDSVCQVDSELREIYEFLFKFNYFHLPQFMRSKAGYDYPDVIRLKEKMNMYNVDALGNIYIEDKFNDFIDKYYKN